MKRVLLLLVVSVLALASLGSAQDKCTVLTVKGTYGISCSGFVMFNGTLVPESSLGTVTNKLVDGVATSTSFTNLSIGGLQFTSESDASGSDIVVNPDCTGTITYHSTYTGPVDLNPAPPVTFKYFILDEGKTLRSMVISASVPHVTTCELRLMTRNTDQESTAP